MDICQVSTCWSGERAGTAERAAAARQREHGTNQEDRGGSVAPASPDPIPIVLLPGFEYRMLEWLHVTAHEIHWQLERRKSTQHGDDDE